MDYAVGWNCLVYWSLSVFKVKHCFLYIIQWGVCFCLHGRRTFTVILQRGSDDTSPVSEGLLPDLTLQRPMCILAGGCGKRTWRVSDKKCVSACATLSNRKQACSVRPPHSSLFEQEQQGTADVSHVWTQRISRILRGRRGLRSLSSNAPQEMAEVELHDRVRLCFHAGGMSAGGADHCGGGWVGWRPGPWCDCDHAVCGAVDPGCDLWQ